jgi:hypothetical protein
LTNHHETNAVPLQHGWKYEHVEEAQYESIMHCKVIKSRIVVSKDYHYLACSRYGIVDENTLIKVKCPC